MSSRKNYLKLIPVFILFVLIFKYIYVDNGVTQLAHICVPIFAGLLLAVILNPILIFIERTLKIKNRVISIILTFIIFLGSISILIYFIIPSIAESIVGFINDVPNLIKMLNKLVQELGTQFYENSTNDLYLTVQNSVQNFLQKLYSLGTALLNTALVSVISIATFFYNAIMAMFISIYILYDKEHFENLFYKACHSLFEKKYADEIVKLGYNLYSNVTKFIAGKLVDSIIIGFIAFIGAYYIIDAPYPVIIGIVIGVTNMIPYFGPFIGGIPMIILTTLYDPLKGLAMLIFVVILQQFDGWVLGPKILGIQLALRPILIICAIIIGGGLFGPIGMFLATPVAAVLKTMFEGYMYIKLKDRKIVLPHDEK